MKTTTKRFIISTLLAISSTLLYSVPPFAEKAAQAILQQKVYIHFDKTQYSSGDIIWFKAYISDAVTHRPDIEETTLFTEIFNINGQVLRRKTHRVTNGYANGEIILSDSVPSGNYIFRAYTLWMFETNPNLVFEKQIRIDNPDERAVITRNEARQNRRFNRNLERLERQFRIEFFPESGNIVQGINNRIAIQSSNGLGAGVEVSGYVTDPRGERVAEIETTFQGKGIFSFSPITSENHTAHVVFPDGKRRSFPIRNISQQGHIIRVETDEQEVKIAVDGISGTLQNDPKAADFILVIHTRGKVASVTNITGQLPFTIRVPKQNLEPGISVATLFNKKSEILAERLFFAPPQSMGYVRFGLEKPSEDFVNINIESDLLTEHPDAYSVSVTATRNRHEKLMANIISHMFLSSDITTHLESPLTYIGDIDAHQRADLLMVTTQWKRLSWKDILQDKEEREIPERKTGFPVYGILTPTEQSIALERTDFEMGLRIGNETRYRSTRVSPDGTFVFHGIDIEGPYEAEVTVRGIRRSAAERVEFFPFRFDPDALSPGFMASELPARGIMSRRLKETLFPRQPDRIARISRGTGTTSYGTPDQVIYLREDDTSFRDMRDVLQRKTTGIMMDGNSITIRGKSSINLSTEPYIIIDGVQYSSGQFLNILAIEISHLEIFKGSNAAIFGVRGVNGVIVGHSRRAHEPETTILTYIFEGYHVPVTFTKDLATLNERFFDLENYKQTIFWQPSVALDSNSRIILQVPVEETISFIRIVLEGVDSKGNVIHATREFDL